MKIAQRDGGITLPAEKHLGPRPGRQEKKEEEPSPEPTPFARLLHGLGREVDRGELMMKRALGAGRGELGPGELLALQAGVYRYSEAVDLSAKLVDRATSGVKTVIQGQ
jgi:hypothetical protein